MIKGASKHQAGMLAMGLILAGFVVMYLGVQGASEMWSTVGIMVTAAGALAVVNKF